MSNTNFSTNMGYSRSVSSGSSSGGASGPSPSAGNWNFDTNIEDYQRTNTSTQSESLTEEDGTIELDVFLDADGGSTYETRTIRGSLGLELTDISDKVYYETTRDFEIGQAAANVVIFTSIISGVLDVGEGLLDGVVWATSTVASWFGVDTSNAKLFISRDLVGEANEDFYKNTEIGRTINNNSFIKYDSEFSQDLRAASKKVTTFAVTTALAVTTGGATAPFAIGLVNGIGDAAESTYKKELFDTTALEEWLVLGSGILTGFSWMATGKLGQGHIRLAKDCISKGLEVIVPQMLRDVFKKDYLIVKLKELLFTQKGRGIYLSASLMTANDVVPYLTEEKDFDTTAFFELTGAFLINVGKNAILNILSGYVSKYGMETTEISTPSKTNPKNKPLTFKEWLQILVKGPTEELVYGTEKDKFNPKVAKGIKDLSQSGSIYQIFSGVGSGVGAYTNSQVETPLQSVVSQLADYYLTQAEILPPICMGPPIQNMLN